MPPLLERLRTPRDSSASVPPRGGFRSPARRWRILGALLIVALLLGFYFWKTSARLLQEPIAVAYGPHDPAFASAMGPLVGTEFVAGNKVSLLVNGDAFFPAMLDAIRGALRTITLETYIWAPGAVSEDFIAALTERARAGVKVHVLVDGMGTLKFKRADRERLRAAGVEFHKYGREHWWEVKPSINHRTHRKILVVDGRVGFTGGMCIDDRWAGNADHAKVWRETQVRIEGPAVRQMQAAFARNWLQTTSSLLLGEGYFPPVASDGSVLAQSYSSGPGEGPEQVRLGYLFAIAAARRSIDISQAYFVPDDLALDLLVAACRRGVRVRLVLPSINDSAFGRAASRSRWGPLLEAGAEIHLYTAAMYHPKTMAVDDLFVTVGSANFDNRSFAINDEIAVNVLDARLAADHRRMFDGDLRRSVRYTLEEHKARPLHIRLADEFCGLFRSQL